jgi:hypothetical protein
MPESQARGAHESTQPAMAPALRDLTLYHYPSTRSARVLWLLHELGPAATGPFAVERVELLEGEGRAEW